MQAQPDSPGIAPAPPVFNEERILGVMPNYQTVNDPDTPVTALTRKQKWTLAVKENLDPFNVVSAGLGAAFSQMDDDTPKYGQGGPAYGMRFGAALADFGTQNFFSAGVLACLLHQDPRYFRKGPKSGVLARAGYSLSRIVITRQDSGASAFNASGVGGMLLGIAASNLYYPSASVSGPVTAGRITTSLAGGVIGNLMSEFWPDAERVLRRNRMIRRWLPGKRAPAPPSAGPPS